MNESCTIYLIPIFLYEDATETIPLYVNEAIQKCQVLFVENERTARRYIKKLDKAAIIDNYEWHTIHKAEEEVKQPFIQAIKAHKIIGIISESGCPCIADPGQILVHIAQQMKANIKPLVGPSSILLALMASGMNGQHFAFNGYLPIDSLERKKAIIALELCSLKKNSTQIFIETPYRNDQLLEALLKTCKPTTRLCIAAELTSANEYIKTKTIAGWKKEKASLHKKPVIFLLQA